MRVAKHLYLDMARALCVLFNQHVVIAKTTDSFAFARLQCSRKVFGLFNRPHALTATARAGLDEHRVTNAVSFFFEQRGVLIAAVIAGHQRHTGFFHQLFGLGLQAHGLDGRRWRANEDQPGIAAGPRKLFVLAQEAIARVNRLCTRGFGGFYDPLPAQVAVFRCAAAYVNGLVAVAHMFGVRVCIRINRDSFDGHAACSCCHAASNFTAIGNEYFFKHVCPSWKKVTSGSRRWSCRGRACR